jgi:hypothetical protein
MQTARHANRIGFCTAVQWSACSILRRRKSGLGTLNLPAPPLARFAGATGLCVRRHDQASVIAHHQTWWTRRCRRRLLYGFPRNVIAPFVSAPGNRNEVPLLREALPEVMRLAREVGMDLRGSVVSLDGVYDCRVNRHGQLFSAESGTA